MRKPRVKVDVILLIVFLILGGIIYQYDFLYTGYTPFVDNLFDGLGFVFILKGVFIRMAARGHKKAHSGGSHQLVTTGLYQVVRNPMYLGTFYIGSGFVLTLLPWWMVFVFAGFFYARFNQQMMNEEKFLTQMFGKKYEEYCRQVPRIFPNVALAMKLPMGQLINPQEMFSTTEKRGLWSWPLLALSCEMAKEYVLNGGFDLLSNLIVYLCTYVGYMLVFILVMILRRGK